MDMWKILGIEPTTDKRAIKRAYAAKTKETHPEEKPEEFKRLYEAYQTALGYADYVKQISRFGGSVTSLYRTDRDVPEDEPQEAAETTDEEEAPDENPEWEELRTYFEENREKQDQCVDAFLKYWRALESPYRSPWELDILKEYLFSAKFQDVRYHPRVLKTLADEIDDKFFYGLYEMKLLFWDAYGFQEDEETAYRGDLQRLWKCLYSAYERHKQALAEEQERIKKKKITCVMIGTAAAAVLAAVLLSFVNEHTRTARECRFLINYMEKQYPQTTFSEPELLGKNGLDGGNVYAMRSLTHPELSTDAEVYYKYVEGRKTRLVRENYERLLFEHHAMQYGLKPGWVNGFNAIIYTDVEELDAVCEKAEKMFLEQEELQTITKTAFYTEQVLFPDVLFWGGLPPEFHAAKIQIFDLRQMTAAELAAQIRQTYMIYMFQYEAWNITAAQYREWGAAYEAMCKEWENDDGEWLDVHDSDTGETLCRLFVSTYERPDTYSYRNGKAVPIYTRVMTLGNAYHFLRDRDANIIVDENGRGFHVKFYGTNTWFGYESEVVFDDLRDCY